MASCLYTNANLATLSESIEQPYGLLENAALLVRDGKIQWLGSQDDVAGLSLKYDEVIDVAGKLVTPGLIDCHTHLVYGGNRAQEFEQRLNGVSYADIAKAGGGIVSTVSATRQASEDELYASAAQRLQNLIDEGVTTVEIKSGYGLDVETEIKMLKVIKRLKADFPVDISSTFLGAHALPPEYKGRADDYISLVCDEMIPEVARLGLADSVDAFCEGIGFSYEQSKRVFDAAKLHNLKVKLHAGQLTDLKGGSLVADYDGLSADHMEYLNEDCIKTMAKKGVAAVLLPGAFYYLKETQLPPIELLRQHKVAIAIATDSNPGSSPVTSLQTVMNMACVLFSLTPEEVLRGVTCHAAKALGFTDRGTLDVGMRADIAIWDVDHPSELVYSIGKNKVSAVFPVTGT